MAGVLSIGLITFIVANLLVPLFAQAGFFSFINVAQGANDTALGNPQSTPLLAVQSNPLLNKGITTTDTAIENDSALVADTGPLGSASDLASDEETPDQITLYVVHKGDSVKSIATLFDVTETTVLLANDLKRGDAIHEGDVLVILPVSGVNYTVKKGDTIASIAKKFSVDAGDIAHFNAVADESLTAGDELVIPGGDSALAKAQAAQQKAKSKPNKKQRSGVANLIHGIYSNQKIDTGFFLWPLPSGFGRISQGMHDGDAVDIAADRGTPILASAEGTVLAAKFSGAKAWFGGFGNFVLIEHAGGVRTLYAHMKSVSVHSGDHVSQGQVIGTVGSTGHSTGPHVHFAVINARHPYLDNSWKK